MIEGKNCGNAAHVPGSRERMGGKTECRDPKDAVAWFYMRYFGPDGGDDARHFITEDARIGCLAGIEGQRLENISEIHPGGFYFNQDLPRLAGWHLEGNKMESVQMPSFARVEP